MIISKKYFEIKLFEKIKNIDKLGKNIFKKWFIFYYRIFKHFLLLYDFKKYYLYIYIFIFYIVNNNNNNNINNKLKEN